MKRFVIFLVILFLLYGLSFGDNQKITIKAVTHEMNLSDFLNLRDQGNISDFTKIGGFVQISPREGENSTEQTEVYLNYDKNNLNIIFVCACLEIQAHLTKRDQINNDDTVGVILDTFNDKLRAYKFTVNPLGIQADATLTEGQGEDDSFDAVWYSEGKFTKNGFAVLLKIPFESIRFSKNKEQLWGIMFFRKIYRNNELSYWPSVSSNIGGTLTQAAILYGIKNVSAGRNMQFIPYGTFRNKTLETKNQTDFNGGLDAKVILKDKIVIDATVNPDFAQVESDEPQIAVNQPYELYYPEKRPFFLENASFFDTPIDLFFSRRIADPQFGLRLTGKIDKWAVGGFVMDDRAPGKSDSSGNRSFTEVVKISRDIFQGSKIGVIYTDWGFGSERNRVVGTDAFLRLSPKWVGTFQAAASRDSSSNSGNKNGALYYVNIQRSGRSLWYSAAYRDVSPDFKTRLGFVTRINTRNLGQILSYRLFPAAKSKLVKLTLNCSMGKMWNYGGKVVGGGYIAGTNWEFKNQWYFGTYYSSDYDWPPFIVKGYNSNKKSLSVTKVINSLSISANYGFGKTLNLSPAAGFEPAYAKTANSSLNILFRPVANLEMSLNYLSASLSAEQKIFQDHIVYLKTSWQFTRRISVRTILRYETLSVNQRMTSLNPSKKINADFLFAYQLNPYSALYVGYDGNKVADSMKTFGNWSDDKQIFVKFSYLIH